MKKKVEVDEASLSTLEVLAAFENRSVESLLEQAVSNFVAEKEREVLQNLSEAEKEDYGLLLLMQQVKKEKVVTEEEFHSILNSEGRNTCEKV